jgi:uncharacterized membrane protein YoaK (UPF0700 family)
VLAASLVQGQSTKALLGIFVFVGYIVGAALAAFLLRQERHNTPGWSSQVTYTLGIQLFLLLALFFGTYANYNYSSLNTGLVSLVLIAALSMGIQFICAKHVNRTGVVTTIVTGTLSNLISRLINRDESTTSTEPISIESLTVTEQTKHKSRHPIKTTLFLTFVWVGYLTGAASSAAALLLVSRSSAAAIPFILVLIVVSYAAIKQLHESSGHIRKV